MKWRVVSICLCVIAGALALAVNTVTHINYALLLCVALVAEIELLTRDIKAEKKTSQEREE